jgi:hypothetical protein
VPPMQLLSLTALGKFSWLPKAGSCETGARPNKTELSASKAVNMLRAAATPPASQSCSYFLEAGSLASHRPQIAVVKEYFAHSFTLTSSYSSLFNAVDVGERIRRRLEVATSRSAETVFCFRSTIPTNKCLLRLAGSTTCSSAIP